MKKRASDAAYTLAMHLLAARLNLAAGACVPISIPDDGRTVEEVAILAQSLLDELGFDGTGGFLRPRHADYSTALELADLLDRYNNGEYCGDFE